LSFAGGKPSFAPTKLSFAAGKPLFGGSKRWAGAMKMLNSALAATRKCGIFCKKESKGRDYTMRCGRSIAIAGRNRGAALRKPQI